ncbi:MAG: hypothetical protein R2805_06615 [Flavobacterium sp.]|uniref:hypothetical protein n=1 Tax=Flavobacterium sp. TaxID=239 RepID=UPI0035291C42
MKNLYTLKVNTMLKCLVLLLVFLLGNTVDSNAQVRKEFTQRSSTYTPTKKIYNVKGDFTMLGNTCLTPQNYGPNTNNNGQFMTYVDFDNDPSTFNSSSSTLVLSNENGAIPSCSDIVYAGLYWTGKSSSDESFDVTKSIQTGTQSVNNNLNIVHNQNIANTNYTLSISRNSPSSSNRNPIYKFSGNGNTYEFNFYNSSATNRVTLSVNGATAINIPVTVNGAGTEATLNTQYVITDGTVTLKIKKLYRDAATNLSTTSTQNSSNADVNVSGLAPVFSNVTKTFNKRQVKIKGPNASSYSQVTASTNNIYYPSGSDDDIFSAYVEVTDYVRTNGIGEYYVADLPLLEGNVGGTGYSGGWGMIVIYENSKMKWRDITIFDGYAYVNSGNSSGYDLPVSGFNTVQSGNVGMKIGVMASEGDVAFTGDYFKIRNLNTTNYTTLDHGSGTDTNFFNSSINAGGVRNPQLSNNTGIDINIIDIPNTNNSIIGNNQTSTNFRYGTNGDTYSIFGIAMSVDAYIPEAQGILSTTTINNVPAVLPYTTLPGQEIGFSIDVRNLGTEAINNYKVIIPIPYNASYVAGSATGTLYYTNPNTTITGTFDPSLGATGSVVWNFGTLPLPANPSVLLAQLSFKLKSTTDCSILNNATCASVIGVNGLSTGTGSTTGVALTNSKLIQGLTQNGNCVGEPIATPINIGINGASYVQQNCPSTDVVRHFTYCSTSTTVPTSQIASNFPAGSMYYNEFPVTINSIEYTDSNPIPLVSGSTVTYYAVPAGGGTGCNFPFTVSKCPKIIAQDDSFSGVNGLTGNPNLGNVFNNNGNGPDTLNGNQTSTSQVTLTILNPANPINGGLVPFINLSNGQIIVPPGTPSGNYSITYLICENGNLSNCDSAVVYITVVCPVVPQPTIECYQTATFNTNTCSWDITGTQPNPPTELLCYQTATWNPTTCQYDVTGEQPAAPTVLCYQTATWNPTTCQYDVTGEQPAAPTVLCYQTATWNPTTCQYDVTGEQPATPTVLCLPNFATWNQLLVNTM